MSNASMWTGRVCLAWTAAVLFSISTSSAMAAVSFTDNFTGSLNPALQIPNDPSGHPTYVMDNGTIHRVGNNDTRYYVSTVASDFNDCDFVATLTYNTTTSLGNDWSRFLFFGIGSAERATYYTEPATSLYFYVNLSSSISVNVDYRAGAGSTVGARQLTGFGTAPLGTSGVFQIEKSGDDITFSWDRDGDGTFDVSQTITDFSTKFPQLDDTNSRLFFGTGWSINTFSSFDVRVPEPATMSLLALSGLALVHRRRR